MPNETQAARAVPLPAASRIAELYAGADLADSYAVVLPPNASRNAEILTRFVLATQPAWLTMMMGVRDAIAGRFGIKTAAQLRGAPAERASRIYIFKIYETAENEMILGQDDTHLDFRLSVLLGASEPAVPGQIMVTTVVHCHNLLGRIYLAMILPFHRIIVRSMLDRAGRKGWPAG
jgi:hypothetical protein